VPSLEYSERALEDLSKLARFLSADDEAASDSTVDLIANALELLVAHPLIGREVEAPYRELVISRGNTGYIALYELDDARDKVIVHAIRHQREVGFEE
jgi:plasmid stabilization system protein ParE